MQIDALTVVFVAGGLCIVGVVIFFLLNVLGGALQIVGSIVGLVAGIIQGGPLAWCGCLLIMGLVCGGFFLVTTLANVLSSCGTPQAINLCRLFGY
jgi:hypothetical protein